jgi:ABC-type spermidine/putrescine transport system permease subunit I
MPSDFSVNVEQLSTMISHAVAPAFLLGAVAALVSILITRMTGITDRIRNLNQITDDDTARMWLKADIARLKRRETLLNQALQLAVTGGICITILLLFGFVVALLGYRHEPGAGALFILALCLLVGSLIRFLQDVRISLSEHDHHH